MKEKITPHLRSLLPYTEIERQYVKRDACEAVYSDPLMEDAHEVVKGLVHKYDNRALIKVSYQCAAHCRFCTRIRQIGDPAGTLNDLDVDRIVDYIKTRPQIDDVILSGGDPIYTPQMTIKLLQKLKDIPSVKVLRIGSRLALQSPRSFQSDSVKELLALIDNIGKTKPFYILLHINSATELTDDVKEVIAMLRELHITLLSQTVFLKGINDNIDALTDLYKNIYHLGILPYYIYHCDNVHGLEDFSVPLDKERALVTQLYKTLSGISCPRFVMDVAGGYGKIPVPLDFINFEEHTVNDYKDNIISLDDVQQPICSSI